jgi:hypothetical protein
VPIASKPPPLDAHLVPEINGFHFKDIARNWGISKLVPLENLTIRSGGKHHYECSWFP